MTFDYDFPLPLAEVIKGNVALALAEDLGPGDLTASLIPAERNAKALLISREAGILCGQAWFNACFIGLDPTVRIKWHLEEGATISAGKTLCEIFGNARAILSAERAALNFLQMLSGVASQTRQYADCVRDTNAVIVDTRKTLPGLRLAQKYAVRIGGGQNHRFALWDAILIKENHIAAAGGIRPALTAAESLAETEPCCRFVQIEVENLADMETAINAGATMLLLDNFSVPLLKQAVAINRRYDSPAILEASGGATLKTLAQIAATGIDRISIGALTKNIKALDFSLRVIPN
ncbi:MAG: carboxylating nicotinate-nucleotide diphosphorylase [Betaproteobacteria bacterium]|nr:carboxylating nicotinate-nucleotide diphosphorylase [Betaproteobacteria bacterium]